MKKVHIVPHMHWDREWYFTTEESRILLVNNMEEIMEMLETNPDYPNYVLDGQTAILEDYFEVCPENRERVTKLVQEGRLIVGPWYSQTDEMVIGGESIVRNLLYGLKDSAKFGSPMKIGYLPDSFGQTSQMPQILNGFDIKYSIFWRGVSEHHGTDKTEFYWESDDGSKVLVQLMPLGYAIGKYLPQEEEELKTRMDKYFGVLDKRATTKHLLLPNGHDQMPIQKDIFEVIEKLEKVYPDREFFLSRYENIFEEVEKEEGLDTIKGEFIDGKYSRVHRSIFSTRMDIKAANTRIENKITSILEPLASIAYSLGFDYHHGLIEEIWKEIMKNHAHDSIGACCSDKVHREIMARFWNAEERTDRLIDFYKRRIVDAVEANNDLDRLTLFNLVPYERTEISTSTVITKFDSFILVDKDGVEIPYELLSKEIIDAGLIDRQIVHYGNYDPFFEYTIQLNHSLPSMGYETLFIKEVATTKEKIREESSTLETDFFTITPQANGTLTITDKDSGKVYEQVLQLENVADDGDEYDFSPLLGDTPIYSNESIKNATTKILKGEKEAVVEISYQFEVPKNLDSRKSMKNDSYIDVTFKLEVPYNKRTIDLTVELDNQANDQRLRMLIPTGISADFSYADNQFGMMKRSVVDRGMAIWEEEGWNERPDPIYPFLNHVSLTSEVDSVTVMTNSSREYEIIGDAYDTIAITLFRGIGVLGKENLVRRPGRPSGIKLPTPDSQMIGKIELEFAFRIDNSELQSVAIGKMTKEWLTPIVSYNKMEHNAMKLNPVSFVVPSSFSLLQVEANDSVLSTLKKAENSDMLVLRYFNPTSELSTVQLNKLEEYTFSSLNLNEEYQADENEEVTIKPNQVVTIGLNKK